MSLLWWFDRWRCPDERRQEAAQYVPQQYAVTMAAAELEAEARLIAAIKNEVQHGNV